jgi:hypothetical protein
MSISPVVKAKWPRKFSYALPAMANYSFSFNDAALGVPCFEGIFYPNNHGSADVTNTRR